MALTNLIKDAGYGIVFLTMISVLVAAHELGHYLFARWFGMGVEEFAIGFGRKPLFVWMRRKYLVRLKDGEGESSGRSGIVLGGSKATSILAKASTVSSPNLPTAVALSLEGSAPDRIIREVKTPEGRALEETTEFTVRPWPLGGFVRIKGMMPEEDGSETKIPGGFYNAAPWKRFLVLLAGPMFSVLAGVFVLILALSINGEDKPVNTPVLGMVTSDGAAAKAGLKDGDRIVAVNGQPIDTFYQVIEAMQASKGQPMQLKVDRGGTSRAFVLRPQLDKDPTPIRKPDLDVDPDHKVRQYKMGALFTVKKVPMSLGEAVTTSVEIPIDAANNLLGLVRKPQDFSDMVGGPATMVNATAEATQMGIWAVLELAALLSISVGILNLLPAPPLDGGQMAMAVAEMIRGGRRLSIRAQAIAGGIGLTFVAALIFAALAVDFHRFTTPNKAPMSGGKMGPAPPAK